jgi:hypothetical protein
MGAHFLQWNLNVLECFSPISWALSLSIFRGLMIMCKAQRLIVMEQNRRIIQSNTQIRKPINSKLFDRLHEPLIVRFSSSELEQEAVPCFFFFFFAHTMKALRFGRISISSEPFLLKCNNIARQVKMSNFVKSIKSPHRFNGENAVSFILCTKGCLGAYFYTQIILVRKDYCIVVALNPKPSNHKNKTKLRAAFFDLLT